MSRLWRWLTTRTKTFPAVGAGWIDVTYRSISGRIVSAVVRPDERPPVELSGIGWRKVVYLQLAGSAHELASRAHRLLAARPRRGAGPGLANNSTLDALTPERGALPDAHTRL